MTTESKQRREVPHKGYQALQPGNDTAEKSVAVYVPFGGKSPDLGEEAQPQIENPLLQYATGLPATRPKVDSEGFALYDEDTGEELTDSINYTGFFTACGMDKDLDTAMLALNVPQITIQHRGGPARHWMMNKVTCFLLAKGVPHNGSSEGKLGIVYLWTKGDGARRSVLYAQVMVRPLLPYYTKPFIFVMRSTQTSDALTAFSRQYRVLNRAHEVMQSRGEDMSLPLWAYSITLKASTKPDIRGSGGPDQKKSIYPMVALIPENLGVDYLQRQEAPLEHIELLKSATENSVPWATALTQRIATGGDQEAESGLVHLNDTPF